MINPLDQMEEEQNTLFKRIANLEERLESFLDTVIQYMGNSDKISNSVQMYNKINFERKAQGRKP